MSYSNDCTVPQFLKYNVPDCLFCAWIDMCGGLIQDDDLVLLQQHTNQTD